MLRKCMHEGISLKNVMFVIKQNVTVTSASTSGRIKARRYPFSSKPQGVGRPAPVAVGRGRALTSSGTNPLLPTAMVGLMPLASWASTLLESEKPELTELDREGAWT